MAQVLGECYWQVAVDDRTSTADYIHPPNMISYERTPEEINWSKGTYLEPETVWSAFRMSGAPPERQGIAPHQPNPFKGRPRQAALSAFLAFVLLGVFQFFTLAPIVRGALEAAAGTAGAAGEGRDLRERALRIEERADSRDAGERPEGLLDPDLHAPGPSGERRQSCGCSSWFTTIILSPRRTKVSAVLPAMKPGPLRAPRDSRVSGEGSEPSLRVPDHRTQRHGKPGARLLDRSSPVDLADHPGFALQQLREYSLDGQRLRLMQGKR